MVLRRALMELLLLLLMEVVLRAKEATSRLWYCRELLLEGPVVEDQMMVCCELICWIASMD